jgi:hypothetical protein
VDEKAFLNYKAIVKEQVAPYVIRTEKCNVIDNKGERRFAVVLGVVDPRAMRIGFHKVHLALIEALCPGMVREPELVVLAVQVPRGLTKHHQVILEIALVMLRVNLHHLAERRRDIDVCVLPYPRSEASRLCGAAARCSGFSQAIRSSPARSCSLMDGLSLAMRVSVLLSVRSALIALASIEVLLGGFFGGFKGGSLSPAAAKLPGRAFRHA